RDAQLEDLRVAARRARLVDTGRTPGEDQPARGQLGHARRRQVVPHHLAEDVLLAHPPGDQLPVLRAEVQDQDAFTLGLCHGGPPAPPPLLPPPPRSSARRVAASTASISAPRTPARSSACSPAMVVPPGLATMSFSAPGCWPVSRTILAAPRTVWAARAVATSRGSPTRTPPSD